MADEAPKYARPEPAGFRLRVLNRNDLKLEDYYYLDYLLKPQPFVEKAAEAWNTRTPSPAQAEWLPISSAPKDGQTLLLGYFNALGKWRTLRGQWFTDEEIAEWENGDDGFEAGWYETSEENDEPPNCWPINPSHWRLLPQPPKEQG